MSIARTIEINDLTPDELAMLFTDMGSDDQARFLAAIWKISQDWPGAGWCMQSLGIREMADANPGCRDAVTTLAAHFAEQDA